MKKGLPSGFSMMQLVRATALLAGVLVSFGCAAHSSFSKPDFTRISVGMPKQQVVAALGKPDEVAAKDTADYLIWNYDSPADWHVGVVESYYVRLVDGKVESFGRVGDHDSEGEAAATSQHGGASDGKPCDLYASLKKLDELHKDGVLTDGEFESQKKKLLKRCG